MELLPPPRPMLYGNRNENVLTAMRCRTTRYQNSFFPECTKAWNNIGVEFRSIDSLSKFKKSLLCLIRPDGKPFFDLHDPYGVKLIFRLRVGLSDLKKHRKDHNFLDTPSDKCDCGEEVEDTIHFLLKCKLYDEPRDILTEKVQNILQPKNLQILNKKDLAKVHLYGHVETDDLSNRQILKATIVLRSVKVNR